MYLIVLLIFLTVLVSYMEHFVFTLTPAKTDKEKTLVARKAVILLFLSIIGISSWIVYVLK